VPTLTHQASIGATGVLIVFAKAPRPGFVKTRMTPPLSPEQASDLYSHLLDDVLEASGQIAAATGLRPIVAIHPAEASGEIAARIPACFSVIAQRGPGLSERMAWAVDEAAAGGAQRILLRGSDSPVLGRSCVEAALTALDDHDLVVLPDRDGGYGLIGLRRPVQGLFDHPMSTATVLDETLANASRMGLRCRTLEPSFDLDTVHDLARLERARAAGETALCPRTIKYLDETDLWRHAGGAGPE
jgi:hypothetical protein